MKTKRFEPHDPAQQRLLTGAPLARFSSRAIAFICDLVLFAVIMVGSSVGWQVLRFGTVQTTVELRLFDHPTWWVLVSLFLYFGVLTYLGHGRSPGKRLMRIRVVSLVHERITLWHCIERTLGYGASTLEGGFGFLQYFIHPNAQTVHDRIAETIVIDDRE